MIDQSPLEIRASELRALRLYRLHCRTDRLFAMLFVLQWIAVVVASILFTPKSWNGNDASLLGYQWGVFVVGGLIAAAPVMLAIIAPGTLITRLCVSIAQAAYSALLIYLTGGRVETHFHVFGSLAFLAFYRDWRVLVPATLVVGLDHLARGMFWPETVYGAIDGSLWRPFEYMAWVVFEDIFLLWSCHEGMREIEIAALTQAKLEEANSSTESLVEQRTKELETRTRELQLAVEESSNMTMRLAHSQKLESIGELAAGVAHEINTPMQFISDNSEYLNDCMERLLTITESYAASLDTTGPKLSWTERHALATEVLEKSRYQSLKHEVQEAVRENLDGIHRVVEIVRAMKSFAHPGSTDKMPTDINQCINSTVTVSRNRWKYDAELILELDPHLPSVDTLPAELNQVILNLLINAADAIREKLGASSDDKGEIAVRTYTRDSMVYIEVKDTGTGMPESVKRRVFDPFYTTKEVGRGTGQGLAISHDIIVNKHGGQIEIDSVINCGTTFTVCIPLNESMSTTTLDTPMVESTPVLVFAEVIAHDAVGVGV